MRIFLKILMAKLKSCGTHKLNIMKTMKKYQVGGSKSSSQYTPTNQPGGTPTAGGAILSDKVKKSKSKKSAPMIPNLKSPEDMTSKEKREAKRDTKRTMKYVKKHGSGLKMKTGGMVNPNSKVSNQTTPGSKGVKSGVNPKASASKRATGRTGGTSTAPKTAVPKAKYGMVMRRK